jgi:hypothetical protein
MEDEIKFITECLFVFKVANTMTWASHFTLAEGVCEFRTESWVINDLSGLCPDYFFTDLNATSHNQPSVRITMENNNGEY